MPKSTRGSRSSSVIVPTTPLDPAHSQTHSSHPTFFPKHNNSSTLTVSWNNKIFFSFQPLSYMPQFLSSWRSVSQDYSARWRGNYPSWFFLSYRGWRSPRLCRHQEWTCYRGLGSSRRRASPCHQLRGGHFGNCAEDRGQSPSRETSFPWPISEDEGVVFCLTRINLTTNQDHW